MDQPDSLNQDSRFASEHPTANAASVPPVPIPEHELISCIGRGSYGQVWLARNTMGTYRAVKIVFLKSFDSERPFKRELSGIRKFEPISRMHEGFIDILQVGINEEQGYFYYIMEVGDDRQAGQNIVPEMYAPNTLASEISRRGRLSLQECLQLGLALSHALAELHKHKLVHRDIKPSNIIFVNGVPKLADIGLVADMGEARSYVGTEGFIPPEGPGSPRADIYSLGKVLYEVSTGRDRCDFPELPTKWGESAEYEGLLELNEIILQACKMDPSGRYSTAWDMHADLVVLVNGKSVKRLKMLERRLANLKHIAGVVALVVAVAAILTYQIYREWRATADSHQRQVSANVAYGNRAMNSGDLLAALPYFAEAGRLDLRGDQVNSHRLRIGSVLAQCPKLTQMWFAQGQVNTGEFSPDGKRVLIAEDFLSAKVYDLQTGQLYMHAFGPKQGLHSASYSPDGRFIFTASESKSAIIWDANSLEVVSSLPHGDKVYSGKWTSNGLRIVTTCRDGVARIWNARSGQMELALPRHQEAVLFATFSRDGKLVLTASRDGTARVWLARDGSALGPPLPHSRWVNWAAFSPDNLRVVTACDDHAARVWDVETGKRILPDLRHNDVVESVEFSPDGRLILTASYDGTARLWSADDLQPTISNPILRHGERVTHAAFSPDGRLILTTCTDGSVRVWDLAGASITPVADNRSYCRDASRFLRLSNTNLVIYDSREDRPISVPFNSGPFLEKAELSSDGQYLRAISSFENSLHRTNHLVRVWSTDGGRFLGPAIVISNAFQDAVISDDGRRVLSCEGNIGQLYDALAGKAIGPPLVHAAKVETARFSPQGDFVVTLSGSSVHVWDAFSGRPAYPAVQYPVPVSYIEFSKDGRYLIACCSDDMLTKCFAQVWEVKTGHSVCPPLRHGDGVLFGCFSFDANRVVTTSEDFTAKVWETLGGKQVGLPLLHGNQVHGAAFSPDGKWIATVSSDHTARIWDPETDDPLTPPLHHLARPFQVKFLLDGHRLVTADAEGHAFVWRLPIDHRPTTDLLELAKFLGGGQFTSAPAADKGQPESPSTLWQRLRLKYPEEFQTSKDDVVRWHQYQVEVSALENNWPAAVFHLDRLTTLCPNEPSISESLAKAREHMASGR